MTVYERRRNVDRSWFQDRLDERKLSMRGLAKLMDVDPSTVSLMIRGLRGLNQDNAQKMATIFSCTTNEVYKRAGLPIEDEARTIDVRYVIGANGAVTEAPDGLTSSINAPYDTPSSGFVVQSRSGDMTDGWLVVVDGAKLAPEKTLGSLAMYCTADGAMSIGIIRRGYTAGRFNVSNFFAPGTPFSEDIDVLWTSPVVWVKPVNPVQ